METSSLNQKLLQSSTVFLLSKTLERAGFYGLRTVLILYMTGEVLAMDHSEAFNIYGIFSGVLILTQLVGAVFGDLLTGSKTTAIVGGLAQVLGAFVICIPNTVALYTGLGLLALGTGFYIPNVFSLFGKIYRQKEKSLDTGFTLFYTAVNIGAFLGILLVGFLGEIDIKYGFITAGIIFLLGTGLLFFGHDEKDTTVVDKATSVTKRAVIILIAVAVTSVFWLCYSLGSMQIWQTLDAVTSTLSSNINASDFSSVSSLATILFGIIAAIAWYFIQFSRFLKIGIGFLLAALSFILVFVIQTMSGMTGIAFYVISVLLLSVAEILVAPIAHSLLVKYGNPKYLALLFTLLTAPVYLFNLLSSYLSNLMYDTPNLPTIIAIAFFGLIGVILVIVKYTLKETPSNQFEE